MLTLDTTIEKINKIGTAVAQKLNKLGIKNVQDLLEYYPFRYDDYSQIVKISELQAGQKASVQGILEFIQNKRSPRKRMMITEAIISDETGQLKVIWFNQQFISRTLKVGERVSLAGLVQEDVTGPQMVGPEYERLTSGSATHTQGLVPVYHLTANLTNKQVRFLIKSVVSMAAQVPELLPAEIIKKYSLMPFSKALGIIHFPDNQEEFKQASRRLKFNELFLIQLTAQIQKAEVKKYQAEKIKFFAKETKNFVNSLPFTLTDAQKKSSWEILQDIQQGQPMSRLLEGDVGSGKTVTVALPMLNVALNKKQSALLVPTEILASQHYDTLCKLFKDSKVKVGLFTRSSRKANTVIASEAPILRGEAKQSSEEDDVAVKTGLPRDFVDTKSLAMTKKEMLKQIKGGKLDIIVGTHAMIQEDVEFKNLTLAIIDEQHRFGVEQRKALRKKSGNSKTIPHL
ncbi:MAG: DEAD/DEAH box helicase, partial [Candidatus Falkowbacteria bacterium]